MYLNLDTSIKIMRRTQSQKKSKDIGKALISNENISRAFRSAIQGMSYRECAGMFNSTEIAKSSGLYISKDTVCRLANGDFIVVNKRIKALCAFMKVDIYEEAITARKLNIGATSSNQNFNDIDKELLKVACLAKENPSLESKLTNILRGITEIVSTKGI